MNNRLLILLSILYTNNLFAFETYKYNIFDLKLIQKTKSSSAKQICDKNPLIFKKNPILYLKNDSKNTRLLKKLSLLKKTLSFYKGYLLLNQYKIDEKKQNLLKIENELKNIVDILKSIDCKDTTIDMKETIKTLLVQKN